MKNTLILLALIGVCCFTNTVLGQLVPSQGVSKVINFDRNTYGSSHQIWSMAQDSKGTLYFTTIKHLVEFDGVNWNQYDNPEQGNLRSVAVADGKIYTGGTGSLGFWTRKIDGKLGYTPMISQAKDDNENLDEFWRVFALNGKVYAQSFDGIYIYNHGKITRIQPPNSFQYSFVINGHIYVQDKAYGLYELIDDRLELRLTATKLDHMEIRGMVKIKNGKIIIATYTGKLLEYNDGNVTPWVTELQDFVQDKSIFSFEAIDNGNYVAIGTIIDGLIIVDNNGKVVQHLNKARGLQNNTILSIFFDKQKNLWLGLDNGISYVQTNTPFTHHIDSRGNVGAVYAAQAFNDKLFLGTNQGVFAGKLSSLNSPLTQTDFEIIPGSQGQVWRIDTFAGKLICGHDKGVFEIKNNQLKLLVDKPGGWLFRQWPVNDSIVIVGHYQGISVLKLTHEGEWQKLSELVGFVESSRFLEIDGMQNIWVAHPFKGVYKIRLSNDFRTIVSKEFYGSNSFKGNNTNFYVLKYNKDVFVSTQKGFFKYDIVKNTFIPDNLMNRILGKDLNIYCLKEIGQKVWVLNDSKVGFFERNGNFFHKDFGEYSVGNNDLIPNFNLMFPLNDSTNLFTSYHGFTLLHRSTLGKNPELFKPFVLAISAIGKDTIHVDLSNSGFPIPFTHNLLKIDFGLPNFGFPPNSISYSIDGKKWVVATGSPIMVSNIGSGEHKLRIKALYSDIQDVTSDEIVFHIAKPWYFSFWGFCIWIFMVIIFSLLVRLVYRRRIKKAHELLEMQQQEALLQQQSHYENEVLKTQQKLMLLENEQLESEVRFKSKELANLVINNIHRNEVLNNIRELFTKVQEESSQKLPKKYYDKLLESIDQYITGNDDWEVFELNFNKAYEGFFKKLKSAHPGLTPNDLRLSAYLRMNLTTKEIAPLLNISVRSVEVSRYRLRKKLDLTHDDNLIDYMLQI